MTVVTAGGRKPLLSPDSSSRRASAPPGAVGSGAADVVDAAMIGVAGLVSQLYLHNAVM